MNTTKSTLLISTILLGLVSVSMTSCEAPDNKTQAYNRLTHYIGQPDVKNDLSKELVTSINGAQDRILVALARLEDTSISDALIARAKAGVQVQVVSDTAARMDPGIDALLKEPSVEVKLGDGEIVYLPDPTLTSVLQDCTREELYIECVRRDSQDPTTTPTDGRMVRPDDYNNMTHNFVVIDDKTVWNFATPLDSSVSYWLGWKAHSQDLVLGFYSEFKQMFGGVFATDLDVYNGPNKSTVHGMVYDSKLPYKKPGRTRSVLPGYVTNDGIINVRFNPQQRLVKELLDELYRARGSVYFVTDQLTNDFVIDALEYKAKNGFGVRVVVREGSTIPDRLKAIQNSKDNSNILRTANSSFTYLPTMMITNSTPDRNGREWPRTAMVMTHPTWHGAPFEVFNPADIMVNNPNDVIRIYPSDLFADGSLWSFHEFDGVTRTQGPAVIRQMEDLFNDEIWAKAKEVQ